MSEDNTKNLDVWQWTSGDFSREESVIEEVRD